MDHQTNRLVQIGNICTQWSNFEYHLAVAIWLLIEVDAEVGKIVTANLDIKQRATMLFALAHQKNAPIPFKRAAKAALDAIRNGLLDRRNQAVHGIHFKIDRADAVGIEMHRGKGGRAQRLQTDAELVLVGEDISRAVRSFDKAFLNLVAQTRAQLAEHSDAFKALRSYFEQSEPLSEGSA